MIKVNNTIIYPTIFPDNTSQVWKLDDNLIKSFNADTEIVWEFEKESELIKVCQLAHLIRSYGYQPSLYMPYMPYARQDKSVDNNSTFALHTFLSIIMHSFSKVKVFDAHSTYLPNKYISQFESIEPRAEIAKAVDELSINFIVYPDESAAKRYSHLSELSWTSAQKHRDQLTGQITSMSLLSEVPVNSNVLVVDDICDGGRTFVEVAKLINKFCPNKLALYISHGIFSQGLDPLIKAGYHFIYTKNGKV